MDLIIFISNNQTKRTLTHVTSTLKKNKLTHKCQRLPQGKMYHVHDICAQDVLSIFYCSKMERCGYYQNKIKKKMRAVHTIRITLSSSRLVIIEMCLVCVASASAV